MAEQRDRWRARMDELVAQVAGWVERNDWVTKPYPKKMRDTDGTVFEVPSLFIQKVRPACCWIRSPTMRRGPRGSLTST